MPKNQNKCRHYWILPTPRGRTSLGKCTKCEETKEFMNMELSELANKSAVWRITQKKTRREK